MARTSLSVLLGLVLVTVLTVAPSGQAQNVAQGVSLPSEAVWTVVPEGPGGEYLLAVAIESYVPGGVPPPPTLETWLELEADLVHGDEVLQGATVVPANRLIQWWGPEPRVEDRFFVVVHFIAPEDLPTNTMLKLDMQAGTNLPLYDWTGKSAEFLVPPFADGDGGADVGGDDPDAWDDDRLRANTNDDGPNEATLGAPGPGVVPLLAAAAIATILLVRHGRP